MRAPRLSRLAAVLGLVVGIAPFLAAQEDLPPQFLRAHALVVRFLASSFVSDTPAAEGAEADASSGLPPSSPRPSAGANSGPNSGPGGGSPPGVPGKSPGGSPPPGGMAPPTGVDRTSLKSGGNGLSSLPVWTTSARRYTVTGAPVAIRLSGGGLVIVVQVTPYDHGKDGLVVVAQGQVWTRSPDGRISYHSAFESLNVAFGEPLYFFPLGIKPDGSTALKVEIAIDRFGDKPSLPDDDSTTQKAPGKPGK